MNPSEVIVLNRARTTFQRVADAKFFNGWIKKITPDLVIAHTCTNCTLALGDEFSFQVYGNKKDAFFYAKLLGYQGAEQGPFLSPDRSGSVAALDLGCEITSGMTFKDCQNQPRFCVEGVVADVSRDQNHACTGALVIDIGPGGFAVLTEHLFKKGDLVDSTLYAYGWMVQCKAEVRSCISNPINGNFQRTGLQIHTMGRVDCLRWKQVIAATLESNRMQHSIRNEDADLIAHLFPKRAA